MNTTENPFKKIGYALIVIGIVDILFMIYCISNRINYSSSFNIFAVISGILLVKGSVRTARFLRVATGFLVASFLGMFIVSPFLQPLDLTMLNLKLNTFKVIGQYLISAALLAILIWVHLSLSGKQVLSALAEAGYKTGRPKIAYGLGLGFVVLMTIMMNFFLVEEKQMAIELAKQNAGETMKGHVSSISVSGDRGAATVILYDDSSKNYVTVDW
ncbi:hypothetical protein [Reinekea marinisedimentorum]|uniref:Uncharacterized protein n=1 Tax=Reinekea marinisedimentorum TaxID=230495 RepID=A0A4R3HRU3_9GAMM|nr:hypothetical protein [Reinekea marinisedimentorum]TCS35702.1 hypothetical protein BCF53_13112 [Reinekea marinisedimentorum]